MIKTMLLSISEAFASAIMIIIILNAFGFNIIQVPKEDGNSDRDEIRNDTSLPHYRWCYESKNLKPDDFCIKGITYREYQAESDDPAMNFRLYGVKIGEESRAAVAKGETRILGGKKVPICLVADKYNSNFCYNDAKMEVHLVAKNHKGQTALVWPNDDHDISKGYRFEVVDGTK